MTHTRSRSHSLLVLPLGGIAILLAAMNGIAVAQSTGTMKGAAPPSRYSNSDGKGEVQPKKPTVYGPAKPAAQPAKGQATKGQPTKGQGDIRPVAGEQPVREPGSTTPGTKGVAGPARPPAAVMQDQPPQAPKWYPLAPNVQQWVDEVLVAWEKTSEQIAAFKCDFQRWDHDPVFGPKDANGNPDTKTPATYGEGVIQYAQPDKGLFRVDKLLKYSPPAQPGDKPGWVPAGVIGEHWVSDGKSIFEFDTRQKRLIQRILPKEMQGKAIADGPLPFLFGAKMATIKARYWIRPLTPPKGRESEYWLEAIPRYRQDAANFQMVHVIIDEVDFLPKALDVFAPNYDPKKNPAHTEYEFKNRKPTLKGDVNLKGIVDVFIPDFYEPKTPRGWTKHVVDMNAPPERTVGEGTSPAQATRPKGTTKTK